MWGKGLIEGMRVTWKHFWGKKETVYYPEEKLPMTERFRGGHLVLDEKKCIGCKLCYSKCPQRCIDISEKPAVIHQENCLHCGNCYEICPARAVVKRG